MKQKKWNIPKKPKYKHFYFLTGKKWVKLYYGEGSVWPFERGRQRLKKTPNCSFQRRKWTIKSPLRDLLGFFSEATYTTQNGRALFIHKRRGEKKLYNSDAEKRKISRKNKTGLLLSLRVLGVLVILTDSIGWILIFYLNGFLLICLMYFLKNKLVYKCSLDLLLVPPTFCIHNYSLHWLY